MLQFNVNVKALNDEIGTRAGKLHKPMSIATAIDTLKDEESTSSMKTDDYWDPWDYDRMWSEISTIEVVEDNCSNIKKPSKLEGLQISCVKRQPSDQTPLLYRRNLVASKDDDLSHLPSRKIPATAKACMTLPVMGTRDKSLLPKNALVRYLGKAVLSTTEIVNLDLSRPVNELYRITKKTTNNNIARNKSNFISPADAKTKLRIGENFSSYNAFVLLRITENTLELEDTSPTIIKADGNKRENKKIQEKGYRLRKLSKHNSQATTRNKLFRRKSSPTMQTRRKIVKDNQASFSGYTSDSEVKQRSKKSSSKCTDIFTCCTRRQSDCEAFSDDESLSSSSLQSPYHTNIVAKFELPRIAYCGIENTQGSFLLAWVYHVSVYDIHVIECHVVECDDRQHAKSLAASLGVSIQKAVTKTNERKK